MLRLTRTTLDHNATVLKAQGQIVGDWVGLLDAECRQLMATEPQVLLDLGDVSYVDPQAVRTLRALTSESLRLINCPPLVEELLTEDAP
jgi:anti-anti-sigma regulatory factor